MYKNLKNSILLDLSTGKFKGRLKYDDNWKYCIIKKIWQCLDSDIFCNSVILKIPKFMNFMHTLIYNFLNIKVFIKNIISYTSFKIKIILLLYKIYYPIKIFILNDHYRI